jgi:hypothetical protein
MKKLFILISFSLIFGQSSFVGEQLEKGSINYADRKIQATGIGYVPAQVRTNAAQARMYAIRMAKVDALRNLVEIVSSITIDSETTMGEAMFSDLIQTQLRAFINGAVQVGDVKYLSDQSMEVTYEVPMSGISMAVLPQTGFLPSTALGTAPATTETSGPTTSGVTGLIIDVRGLGLRPAMSPRIMDQNGGVVYGPGNYTREYAIQNGVAGYAKGLEKASADDRVKGNPLVIKGVSASGANKADVVISNADVMKIQSANSEHGVLRDCRLIFVLD